MVHQQAEADAIQACGYVDALRSEIARLEGNVRHLATLSTGAINDPLVRMPATPHRLGGHP